MHTFAIVYLLFALYALALLFASSQQKVSEKKEYVFIGISFFSLMFFHVFVDSNSVEDLYRYEYTYKLLCKSSFLEAIENDAHFDFIWAIFNKIATIISGDFTFLLLLYNIILLGSVYYISSKYSPYLPVSILIFILLAYDQSLFVLRQYLATALLVLSVPCIINKKIFPYLILCFAAFFCHKSAIIWMPLYYLFNIKNQKLYIGILVLAIVLISFICDNPLVLASFFDDYYIEYLENGIIQNNTMKLIALSYLLCYIIFVKKHILDEGINKLCFSMLLIYTVIYCFAPPIGIISRVLKYYELSLFLVIPITMSYIKNSSIKFIYLICIMILQGYLYIRGLNEDWIYNYRLQDISFHFLLMIFISMILLLRLYKGSKYHGRIIS